MDGYQYERHVAQKIKWRGFIFVKRIGKSGDYGADVVARDLLLRKVVIQCKHYSGKVGVSAVQQVIAAKQYYRASVAVVATNSQLTRHARKLAERCGVKIWEHF